MCERERESERDCVSKSVRERESVRECVIETSGSDVLNLVMESEIRGGERDLLLFLDEAESEGEREEGRGGGGAREQKEGRERERE